MKEKKIKTMKEREEERVRERKILLEKEKERERGWREKGKWISRCYFTG